MYNHEDVFSYQAAAQLYLPRLNLQPKIHNDSIKSFIFL